MKSLLLKNVRVAFPGRHQDRADLLLLGGRIHSISESPIPIPAEVEIDLSGQTLLPGFIDVHIHGVAGIDLMIGTAEQLGVMSRYLATQGVTAWMPTFVPSSLDQYRRATSAIAQSITNSDLMGPAARVVGIHYEGPFVNHAQCGALHREHFRTFEQKTEIDDLPRLASGRMMMTVAPEIDGGIELIRALQREGWVISIGHTRASIETLDKAFEAGARHMTHFMNAMSPLHHRSPGPVAWGLSRDDVTCDIIADGIHLDEFVLKLLLKLKGAKGLALISDAIAAAGSGDGEYQIWGETIRVENGRTSNAQGSIAGSVITMLDAFRLMRSLGASDVELAEMASLNPARLLGLDRECGSIEVGKRADLVAIDASGNVKLTLVGGEVAYRE